ncbi:DEAD/DEAH box helicase [Acidianus sulfidivorans JP7]|uniref:DEAD/DEAH box helicase n=1 Tax=Acidianus sulfidivorans JP7 TaxID=619593 RepID=A0A2U9INS5_9CREN|nr:ATP-dependent DNA helicase [Acidianus sulfidivorans]AWR97637.1 DEAD/DEAH box helicase [Acidianus sulfidivorans JP7]
MDLREWQSKLKDRVLSSFKNNYLVALQAPTGSGKTLFSMITSLEYKGKIIYAVRTHNEYFPIYREAKRLNKKFSFIVGKSIACPFATEDTDGDDIKCTGCEIFSTAHLEINDYPFSFLSKIKKEGIELGYCPYYSLFSSLQDADIIALTYPYFFIPRLRDSLGLDLSEYVIVIDEAHNLDRLNDLEERKINSNILDIAISQTKNDKVISVIKKLKNDLQKTVYKDEKYISVNDFPKLTEDEIELLQEEYDLLRDKMIKEKKIKKIFIGNIIKFYQSEGMVFSYKGSLVKKPLTPSKYTSILNEKDLTILLMSGTLQPINYLNKVLGITRQIDYIDAEKETRKKLSGSFSCYLSLDVTSTYSLRTKEMWKKYSSYLLKIYYQAENHVLSIFPSYLIMNEVMKMIEVPKIVESERTKIEDLLRLNKKTIIAGVARGKLSEGVEITDKGKSLISDVVLVGIPYPPVDDFLKMQAKEIEKSTKINIEDLLISIPALVAVKQAIGRAIRSVNDNAKVWLLDKRYDSIWWKTKINCFNPKKIRL